MKTLIDMHTHTGFSPDGEGTVEQSLAKAKELGLAAFAITDHCDCNFRYKADHYGDPEALKDGMMYGSGKYAPASIVAQYEASQHLEGLNFLCGIELVFQKSVLLFYPNLRGIAALRHRIEAPLHNRKFWRGFL